MVPIAVPTGAAAPIDNMFADIPGNFWASAQINRLAAAGIVSGYPDRTFKPNLPVSRAEFASMSVAGLNLQSSPTILGQVYTDVPRGYWAGGSINRSYNKGLISGYPDSTYHPSEPVTRAEALTILSRALPYSEMTVSDAEQVLSQYRDSDQVPYWARISVARAAKGGLLQGSPNPSLINPNRNASRADVAAMLSQLRQTLALEVPSSPAAPTGAAVALQQQTITLPVMNVKFNNIISARANHTGDAFSATTLEPITVDNVIYPQGSTVRGRIVEVIRPNSNSDGALRLAFTDISNSNGTRSALPRDILTAQVQKTDRRTVFSRLAEFPFVWPGRVIGTTGRSIGGMVIIAGNSSEQVLNNLGLAAGNLTQGAFAPAGRSAINSAIWLGRGALDVTKTALSGAAGILNVSSDEIGYLTGSSGERVASIYPREVVSIAFGCQ